MTEALSPAALSQLFLDARTHNAWTSKPVSDELLRTLYGMMRMAPTAVNAGPARIVFVKSPEAKAKLLDAVSEGNREKTAAAPVTAIIGYDLRFYEKLDRLFPHANARVWFEGNEASTFSTAFRNSSMQGGYLILAARALGLDCGPMSGFDNAKVDERFFPDCDVKSNFLCNLGYADTSALHPRNPRLEFEEVCQVV